ncbi:hypothetical protein L1887_02803 [Cichorium endivia]|nr:hypothetical protein L1887_02803 [Cichorium endivia]
MDEQILMNFALKYGYKKVKENHHCLKSRHTKFTELINNTGVTWDSVSGKVFANDTVRDDFFKGCKIYPLLSVVFGSSSASGAFHNASTCAPQTSEEEEHRIETAYLYGDSFGDSEFDGGSRKGKHVSEGGTIPGSRRMKKSFGSSKYDTLLDAWSKSMIARKERDLAKAEQYKSKHGDVTSALVDEYFIVDCMTTLDATPDVSTISYPRALTFFPDINWRKMFMMMS